MVIAPAELMNSNPAGLAVIELKWRKHMNFKVVTTFDWWMSFMIKHKSTHWDLGLQE